MLGGAVVVVPDGVFIGVLDGIVWVGSCDGGVELGAFIVPAGCAVWPLFIGWELLGC